MKPEEKIKYVKDAINELVKISPTGPLHIRLYTLTDYEDGPTLLSVREQWSIIQKLDEEKFIRNVRLDEDKHGAWFEIVSRAENKQDQPIIREHTLERIARFLGDHGSGPQIVGWLRSWGVPQELIEYPNTKWRMVFDVLNHYTHSAEEDDRKMLFKIIAEILHPLMFNGDKAVSEAAAKDFNKFLEYDGVVATYSGDDKKYYVYRENDLGIDSGEMQQILNEELFQQEHSELEFLQQPENREKISALRKTYQLFMNIVEVFCDNPSKPSHELNDAYIKTKKLITDIVWNLNLHTSSVDGVQKMLTLAHYSIPFNNLFTAEKEYTPDHFEIDLTGKKLTWDYIRPLMHATYGDIDDLYRRVDGSDILSKPYFQQTLNDVSLLLSKTKEENRKQTELKRKEVTPKPLVHKIEITKMPSLHLKDSERRQGKSLSPKSGDKTPENFSVAVKDREIWVNDFLLRKPHAIGKNKEFFDYVFENDGKSLEREKMPDYVKQEVGGKGFSKVLNDLGFKGEILKVFFPERGKSTLLFRKTVTVSQIEKAGVRVDLFLQELRTAHTKNSPI